jgi:exosortase/archaeosortase
MSSSGTTIGSSWVVCGVGWTVAAACCFLRLEKYIISHEIIAANSSTYVAAFFFLFAGDIILAEAVWQAKKLMILI